MTRRYEGDCCPVCGSFQVLPYALILGGREEYGYHCESCQVTWRVLTHDPSHPAVNTARSPAA